MHGFFLDLLFVYLSKYSSVLVVKHCIVGLQFVEVNLNIQAQQLHIGIISGLCESRRWIHVSFTLDVKILFVLLKRGVVNVEDVENVGYVEQRASDEIQHPSPVESFNK